jgi:hypothetical protein
MADAIVSMRDAFSSGAEAPLRQLVGNSLLMPGRIGDSMAVKIVSIVPGRPAGLVAVFNGDGEPVGILDGLAITAIRKLRSTATISSGCRPFECLHIDLKHGLYPCGRAE